MTHVVVDPRVIRRVIKHQHGLSGFGLEVPHGHCCVVERAPLLTLVTEAELGRKGADLEAVLAAVDLRGMAALGQLEDALAAAELERSKGSVRIRLWSHDAAVEGWIDASALGPAPPPGASILSGGRDTSRAPSRRPPLRCPNDIALYVRAADEVVRVGTLRAGGRVQVVDEAGRQGAREDEREHDEVPVDLGANAFPNANGTRRLTPFVDRASLTACAEVARSAP